MPDPKTNSSVIELPPIDIFIDEPSGPHGKETGGSSGGDDSKLLHDVQDPGTDAQRIAQLKASRVAILAKEPYRSSCNKLVIEYSKIYARIFKKPKAVLPAKDANGLVAYMEKHLIPVDGRTAKAHGDSGEICYAVKSATPHGHVMIVVGGPGKSKGKAFYPNVMGGGTAGGFSDGSKTAADTWKAADLAGVKYYVMGSEPVVGPTPEPDPVPER